MFGSQTLGGFEQREGGLLLIIERTAFLREAEAKPDRGADEQYRNEPAEVLQSTRGQRVRENCHLDASVILESALYFKLARFAARELDLGRGVQKDFAEGSCNANAA